MYAHEKILRKRSVDNILAELAQAKSKLPFVDKMVLDDDAFFKMFSVEEIRDFSEKYKEKIGLPLDISGATPATLTREKLSLLVGAGLRFIRIGIQTGSERSKKLYKRHYPNKMVEDAVKIINEFKDKLEVIMYDIIIDNPWESDEDIIETLMFLSRFPAPYVMAIYSLTFYPGTELYDKAKKEGIISDDMVDVYQKHFLYVKKTYLNKLFYLLNDYVRLGHRIYPKTMRLLTNKKMRKLKLNWLVYFALNVWIVPVKINYLLREGFKDIRKGHWFRINRYISDFLNKKRQA